MIIIVANNLQDSFRGMLKRWFVEPRPNIFVASLNEKVRKKVLDYISLNSSGYGFIVIYDDPKSVQGFTIETYGEIKKNVITRSGLSLIADKQITNPF